MSDEITRDPADDAAESAPDVKVKIRGAARAAAPAEDLSEEVARAVAREPGEQVTCRRVGDHHYRCNFWSLRSIAAYDNPSMLGSLVTTSRISRSQFLHVTRSGGDLKIRVDTR